jgi:HPt (histidine-containing phosphotransfer) domain-containing protein
MDPLDEIPFLDPYAFNTVMKMGGKKKLDTLLGLLRESAPARLQEIKAAPSLAEAKAAAAALKTSAGNLGLARLEDSCDQILAFKTWDGAPALVASMEQSYRKGLEALLSQRGKI